MLPLTSRLPIPAPSPRLAAELLAALVSVLLLTACSGPADSPAADVDSEIAEAPSVRPEFDEVCESIRESEDPFYGVVRERRLRQALAEAEPRSSSAVATEALLGRELLKLDRAEESIEHLTAALAAAPRAGLSESVKLDMAVYLGLALLQAGEDQNCLLHHSAASCILPLTGDGVHSRPEYARRAGDVFLDIARDHPNALQSLWLLNLARMASGDYPDGVPARFRLPPEALEAGSELPRWTDRAPELGIAVTDLAGGAVVDDFDGDGFLDLLSSTWDPCGSLKAFRGDGRGGFEEVTEAWRLDEQLGGLNLVHADFDGDGRLDLLVLRGAWMGPGGRIRNSLLRNVEGSAGPRFVDVTRTAGLAEPAYPTQTAAWADYDLDGDLDLYVGNEDPDGNSYPSQLFRNNGDRTFTDVAVDAGVMNMRYAKAVTWGDFDDDGDPDLYVSNIGPNRLYRNDGDGTFTDVAIELDVAEPVGRSFASWFFDYDNDGDLDLFVADYESPVPAVAAHYFGLRPVDNRPRLYRNDGGRFTEVGREAGLERALLPMGANYGDLDADGWPDLYLGTGEPGFETVMPNVMYRNRSGRGFEDVTFAGGFGHLQKGHGVAFGDVDHDGDQDLFHQLGGFFPGDAYSNALFENPTQGASWITLALEGAGANSHGVGARVTARILENGERRTVHALVGSGGSFGGSTFRVELGLGRATRIDEIVIRWPGERRSQTFEAVRPNRAYRVVQGAAQLVELDLPRVQLGGGQQGSPRS
jgi:hypothetical protein